MVVNLIRVEVVYALPQQQTVLSMKVAASDTVRQVIEQCGILQQHPDIDLETNMVGVFGRQVKLEQSLHEGDRIEIYRLAGGSQGNPAATGRTGQGRGASRQGYRRSSRPETSQKVILSRDLILTGPAFFGCFYCGAGSD
ncbi:hypothetical protein BFR47_03025 [Oceanisphaera psychrotolerans]|uniref:UPF0125 protein BFR47_03025 n=1 Tax=Oceanisphaera psychrotolerans TaxID=1414654 RepID=A0A1J4QB60_9GAMM|nr:hypothetical protein BFR47_03025 [Oceanisphaera psychrotolerans]